MCTLFNTALIKQLEIAKFERDFLLYKEFCLKFIGIFAPFTMCQRVRNNFVVAFTLYLQIFCSTIKNTYLLLT